MAVFCLLQKITTYTKNQKIEACSNEGNKLAEIVTEEAQALDLQERTSKTLFNMFTNLKGKKKNEELKKISKITRIK